MNTRTPDLPDRRRSTPGIRRPSTRTRTRKPLSPSERSIRSPRLPRPARPVPDRPGRCCRTGPHTTTDLPHPRPKAPATSRHTTPPARTRRLVHEKSARPTSHAPRGRARRGRGLAESAAPPPTESPQPGPRNTGATNPRTGSRPSRLLTHPRNEPPEPQDEKEADTTTGSTFDHTRPAPRDPAPKVGRADFSRAPGARAFRRCRAIASRGAAPRHTGAHNIRRRQLPHRKSTEPTSRAAQARPAQRRERKTADTTTDGTFSHTTTQGQRRRRPRQKSAGPTSRAARVRGCRAAGRTVRSGRWWTPGAAAPAVE